MTRDLEGRTALVTGASRGIGRGIAERLGAAGALVAVNYAENEAAARATVAAIEAVGGQAFALQAKIGARGAAEALAAALDTGLTARTGSNGLDILVNNVGIGDYKGIADTSDELLHHIFDSNVFGPFKLTRALLPRLRDNGRVINISSSATRLEDKDTIAYNMSKAAVEMFTRSLARQLGERGITVNSVAPGFTETDVNAGVMNDPAMVKAISDSTLLRRFATVEDIADFVHALAGEAGRWVTAQNIEASGGLRMA
jgi:3-oxoacyl-[acyl-carrier protein] reductase